MDEVKLLGAWPSPFSYRVIWALKLKSIPYEYIEEDLSNKSSLLLQSNPLYNKIPVLVHDGKPVCESTIILEYIEEVWPQRPLMPTDPYERTVARFWIKFVEEKGPAMWMVFRSSGEEQEKAVFDTLQMLETIEHCAIGEKKFFGGEEISMVDLAFGQLAHWLGVIENVTCLQILEARKFPRLTRWTKNFNESPIIGENLPNREEMFAFFKRLREGILS